MSRNERRLVSRAHASFKSGSKRRVLAPGDPVDESSYPPEVIERWLERGTIEEYVPEVVDAVEELIEPFEGARDATVDVFLALAEEHIVNAGSPGDQLRALATCWSYEFLSDGRKGVYDGLVEIGAGLSG